MRVRTVFATVALLAALTGCQKADPIIGTWTSSGTMQGMNTTSETTFGADKTYKQTATFNIPGGQSLSMSATGAWAWEEGNKLKVTANDITFETANAQLQQLMSQNKQMMLDQINNEVAQPVTWAGNDSFTMTYQGQQVTFNRKK